MMMNGTGSVSPKLLEPSVRLTNGHSKEVGVAHTRALVECQVHGKKPIDELNCGSQKMCVYLGDSGCSSAVLIVREQYSNTHHFKCLYYH